MKKLIRLDGLEHPVILSRRKGTRNIRLSVASNGTVRLTVPFGIPEIAAKKFAQSKVEWIQKHYKSPDVILDGAHIGKSHTLFVEHADITRPNTKIDGLQVRVRLPLDINQTEKSAQVIIRKACEKALLKESEGLLPQRLAHLSQLHHLPYRSVSVKKLRSRWGACDSSNNISLNSYLIQLDWKLIDYVLCHELAHTIHHNHSEEFWELVAKMLPEHKQLRSLLKAQPTDVITT